ncbi:MAG TPA: glycosyltransferase [Nocardioides sp.]|uniref:glycosyltransferase n=1 Tax=Nocardioides sp. TaxID=35761 RepID=UPI002C09F45C|nr:glycosyltransferase [Nocardioides sp.]HQR26534.1 glycosyltransferase [Nocardioides sp.]
MTVAVLLVSHGGSRWLPAVLTGIAEQTTHPDRRVAVDTGSKDDSADLIAAAWGEDALATASRGTSFGEAVDLGLAAAGDVEWVWLLHDDANPAPTALAELLAAARAHPEADVLGPKLREWPSLRRLLEVGVTLTGTGRRETGLERGEYDQGQHDEVRRVLAVNTAGMLVRRSVLVELGGLDRALPVFGNDLDLGWRAAAAGHTTLIVPQALVFHAEAAHRGTRRTPLTGRHTHYQERRAALYTLLANVRTRGLVFQTVRLAVGTLLRMIGFLLVRSVGEALDELAALLSLYARPGQIRRARAARRPHRTADPATVRALLAPWWLPYRHGLDLVGDLVAAASHQAQDVAERRRAAGLAAGGHPVRPRVEDDDELGTDTGLVARFLTSPVAVAATAFVVLALVGARAAFGRVSGGALSPAPGGAGDWWRLQAEYWHPLLTGTDVPAPPYVPALAVLATVLGGSAGAAVSALLLLAVPFAFWGAWRFLRVTGHLVSPQGVSRWLLVGGAATFALVPATSGAWGEGRFGTVATAALLPWLAHAALGFGDPDPDRRWRAAWRTGLLLALATAFTPALWLFALGVGALVLVLGLLVDRRAVGDRSVLGPPATALAVVPVLLVPWLLPLVRDGAWSGLLMEAGRLPSAALGAIDLLTGRAADTGAPTPLGVTVLVLAVLALVPRGSRVVVLICWLVALVAALNALVLAQVSEELAATTFWPGLGVFVVILQGAWLTAVVVAGQEALRQRGRRAGRVAGLLTATVLTVVPALGLAWFVVGAENQLSGDARPAVPAYMVQSSALGPAHGVLILDGSVEDGVSYSVRRGDGTTVGEDEVQALTPEDRAFTATVRALVSRPTTAVVNALADQGIEYVVLQAPADSRVAATLDATNGLSQASAEDRSTRAWHVDQELDPDALTGPDSWQRTALLVLQALALLLVLVLAGPTRRRERP